MQGAREAKFSTFQKKAFFKKSMVLSTNKGFNWKNADSTVRKRFTDVFKQNT